MSLVLEGISVVLDGHRIVKDVGLNVETGSIAGVIGPNGSGKSTLLRTVYRALRPVAGRIRLDGVDLLAMPIRESARRVAAVPQEHQSEFDFAVADVVAMGRIPHKGAFDADTSEDRALVDQALDQVGMAEFRRRRFGTLSGGEKQRVLVARALAQQAELLVLDEPTNHLDVRYQLEVMDLLVTLGTTALVALHDLNIAALYCKRLYVIHDGQVVANGPPDSVLTPDLLESVFGVRATAVRHPVTGITQLFYEPQCTPAPVTNQSPAREYSCDA